MNILHVLSQVHPTGSEYYAGSLADQHIQEGHKVIIVSDTLTVRTDARHIVAPIANRKHTSRLRNILFLKKLIRQESIDVVHAHSRASSWVSYFATRGTKIPLISTVHGRQAKHTSSKSYDIYGDKIIAVCHNILDHLVNEINIKKNKISVIPNGFTFPDLTYENKVGQEIIISLFGRTNGPKGQVTAGIIKNVVPEILKFYPKVIFQIAGGKIEDLGSEAVKFINALNQEFGDRIQYLGFINNLPEKIQKSSLVIGSGRVAIESLSMGVPLIAVGEALFHGLITERNLTEAQMSNFGDISSRNGISVNNFSEIEKAIQTWINGHHRTDISSVIRKEYSIGQISKNVMAIYQSAFMKKTYPRPIPVLMYHKVVDKELVTQHKIYVTVHTFKNHLKFLHSSGFTPITFKEYLEFSELKYSGKKFPHKPVIITFDDGYRNNYTHMLPLMKQYHFKGVLFLLGDFKISYNFWDADQGEHRDELMDLEEKKAFVAEGWEIGAHSMSHPDLTKLSAEEVWQELNESKNNLETSLQTQVISFAYPTGHVNNEVKDITQKAGFTFGVSTDTGGLHLEDDRFQIFRVNIFPHDGIRQLKKKTAWWYRYYYRWKRKK